MPSSLRHQPAAPGRELVELSREQCLARLGRGHVGRLAVAGSGEVPVIRPISYHFDERSQSVVFRTREGTKLAALRRSTQAAFEIDEIDPASRRGWSVIVTGVTEEVTDTSELGRLGGIAFEPWAAGADGRWIRIRARTVSGRDIRTTEPEGR